MADGVYSMFADLAPFDELRELLDRYQQLHLYIDDSHGVGWAGKHGRGPALDAMGMHPRVVAACSLNKSFATAGGAIVFPNAEMRRKVRTTGGPMIFSGPVQPPLLGAAIQSAKIHLSDELPVLQAALRERIELFTDLADEFCIPLASRDVTPIRYIPLGLPDVTHDVLQRLVEDGYYTNLGTFPAVPMKHAGVRVTLTLHHTLDDIRALVESLARHVPAALERGGEAAKRRHAKIVGRSGAGADAGAPPLRRRAGRGASGTRCWASAARSPSTACGSSSARSAARRAARGRVGLPLLRRPRPRGQAGAGDVLHGGAVEGRHDGLRRGLRAGRAAPRRGPVLPDVETFAMGSLLTEGDHLYLDRNADWKGALDLLMGAVSEHAQGRGRGDDRLPRPALRRPRAGRGGHASAATCKTSLPDSLVYEPVAGGDEEWLAALSLKARVHQRKAVLPFDDAYDVEWLRARRARGQRRRARPPLRRSIWPCRRAGATSTRSRCRKYVPARHARAPVVGADDADAAGDRRGRRVRRALRRRAPLRADDRRPRLRLSCARTARTARRCARRSLRARALGSKRVLLGMGATFEKTRFGAHVQERVAFAQASDHYSSEVLGGAGRRHARRRSVM